MSGPAITHQQQQTQEMQCDICFRTGGHKLPFLCPTDARNRLFEQRLDSARVLLEHEVLSQQVGDALPRTKDNIVQIGPIPEKTTSRWDIDQTLALRDQKLDETQQIIAHADELRNKIASARQDIAKRKASIVRRQSELASASNGIEPRRAAQVESIDKSIKRTQYRWNQVHRKTVDARAYLCNEAAKLYGLKARRVRQEEETVEKYMIGGAWIVDLRDMNSKSVRDIVQRER